MKKLYILAAALGTVFWVFSPAALADTIGPDCSTCQGGYYTLTNLGEIDSSGVYRIRLDIDATNLDITDAAYINAVAIKVSSDATATIESAPGGAGAWTEQDGGLNSSGCDGSGSGFVCAEDSTNAPVPGTYSWIFDVDVLGNPLFSGMTSSIKVQYVDANGDKVGDLVSEDITLQPGSTVPEPASLLLLGTGLAGLAGFARRRARSAA